MGNNSSTTDSLSEKYPQNDTPLVQNAILLWLDINIVKDSPAYQETVIPLQSVIHTIKTYTYSEECFEFIQNIKNEKIFLLISGSIGQHIVPRIHNMTQVDSIIVYCGDISRHRLWAAPWPKIRGVFNEINSVREALKQANDLCEQNSIPISLLDLSNDTPNQCMPSFDPSLICTRILKEIFLTIEFQPKHLTEFTNRCRTLFTNNKSSLKDVMNFEESYRLHTPIWWYTYDSFLRPMLNYALSHINLELSIKLAFFIVDLHRQIEQLHKEQFLNHPTNKTFTVCRGQGLSLMEFQRMRESKNGLISFNNFLLTTKSYSAVLELAQRISDNPDLVGIFFNMTVDPSKFTVPFAFIKDVGFSQDDDEVLFSINAIFRICEIEPIDENNRIFRVHLTLTNDTEEGLQAPMDHIREETFPQTKGWHRLGLLLLKFGEAKQAGQIYQTLLEQTSTQKEKALIYHELGRAKYLQKEYQLALQFFERSLEIYRTVLPATHSDLSTSYYYIGLVYQNMNQYPKALSSHEKALEIRQQSLPPDHSDIASSYSEIGRIYFNMNERQKAISAYDKVLAIRQKTLPANHPDLLMAYNNLGEVYEAMNKYFKSISFYEKSLEIKEQLLPSNHPDLATAYNNLAKMYYTVREFSKAMIFYEKALDILQRTVPPNFLELVICYGNIGLTYENMGDHLKASSSYERAISIGENAALTDKSIVQQQQKNLERVTKSS